MEVLCRKLINEVLQIKSSIGFKIRTKGFIIFYLLFADDSLIFCKAEKRVVENIKRILDEFS